MTILEALGVVLDVLTANQRIISALTVIALFFVEFNKKIKVNPISAICSWLGKACGKDLINKISSLEDRLDRDKQAHIEGNIVLMSRIDAIENKLDSHISESIEKDMRDRRISILDYANSILNGRNHTKEEYKYMLSICDSYEMDCIAKNIINSVADEAIHVIKHSYSEKLKNNDFL